jgi:hypothetical protein
VSAFHWRERSFEIASQIAFSPPGGNRIAEDLSAVAQSAVSGFQGSPLFDTAKYPKQLRGGNVGYWRATNPREDIPL